MNQGASLASRTWNTWNLYHVLSSWILCITGAVHTRYLDCERHIPLVMSRTGILPRPLFIVNLYVDSQCHPIVRYCFSLGETWVCYHSAGPMRYSSRISRSCTCVWGQHGHILLNPSGLSPKRHCGIPGFRKLSLSWCATCEVKY